MKDIRTPAELSHLRRQMITYLEQHYNIIEPVITCDKCDKVQTCRFSFDIYNTDGDCLEDR